MITATLSQRWPVLSLVQQMAHIGGEVSRGRHWREKDFALSEAAFENALELLGCTIADPRWRGRLRELTRLRELLRDSLKNGSREYACSFEELDQYFLDFARAARQ